MTAHQRHWRPAACNLCYINGGIEVGVDACGPAARIVKVRGDKANPRSRALPVLHDSLGSTLSHGYGQVHPNAKGERLVCGPAANALTSSGCCDPVVGTPCHKHVPVRLERLSPDTADAAQRLSQQLREATAA